MHSLFLSDYHFLLKDTIILFDKVPLRGSPTPFPPILVLTKYLEQMHDRKNESIHHVHLERSYRLLCPLPQRLW